MQEEPDQAEITAKALESTKEKFDKSFTSIDDLVSYAEELYTDDGFAMPAYIEISCLENSAQHTQCIQHALKHTLIDAKCDDICNIHDVYENDYIAPTCTQNGYKGGIVCRKCEKVFEAPEIIPPTGHSPVYMPETEATCSTSGLTEGFICETCHTVLSGRESIPAKSHADTNGDGLCDVCGQKCSTPPKKPRDKARDFVMGIINAILALFRRLFG